jgi:hypothetical protein
LFDLISSLDIENKENEIVKVSFDFALMIIDDCELLENLK